MEQQYRTLIETTRTGFVVVDGSGRVLEANDEYVRLAGRPRAEVVGRSVFEWTADYDRQRNELELERCLEAGSATNVEIDYTGTEGQIVPVEINASVYRESGEVRILGFCRDIASRREADRELRASLEQLRALIAHQETVREEERTRIARELHDELGQSLTALKMDLALLKRRMPASGESAEWFARHAAQMNELVDDTIQSVRRVARELRQGILEDFELVQALSSHAREFHQRFGIPCKFDSSGDFGSIERSKQAALFRIAQECLTNVARHSGAREARIKLARESSELVLAISDNGRGIAAEAAKNPSLGLLGMRERVEQLGGRLEIAGREGAGTTVTARIPE